jgi:hypothetical protein
MSGVNAMNAVPRFATFDSLAEAVRGHDGRRRIEASLAALLHRGDHAEAQAALASYIALFPDPALRQVVSSFSSDRLVIGGWDAFHGMARRYRAGLAAIAFSGNGLSYSEPVHYLAEAEYRKPERVLLVCTYYEETHPLAGDPAAMAAHLDQYGTYWINDFDEIHTTLWLNGADPMMAALNTLGSRSSDPDSEAMMFVCGCWLVFHLHRAVARDLAQLDFGCSLPILVTAQDFSVEIASLHEASGSTDPRDFEAARPKDADEIREKIRQLEWELMAARKRERKRAKKEEREYLDRDGELTAGAESLRNMFRAYRKGDMRKVASEGANLIDNWRKLYRKYDY